VLNDLPNATSYTKGWGKHHGHFEVSLVVPQSFFENTDGASAKKSASCQVEELFDRTRGCANGTQRVPTGGPGQWGAAGDVFAGSASA